MKDHLDWPVKYSPTRSENSLATLTNFLFNQRNSEINEAIRRINHDFGVRHAVYARDIYVPSAVSMRIFSPSLMNGGTCTTRPVSILAGLVTELAVADLMPGSVSTTVISTWLGSSMPTGLPS